MCSDCSTDWPFPCLSLSLWPPYSLRHNNIEIRPINNPTITSSVPVKGWSHFTSFTLNQKLEMIKINEEGMSKAKSLYVCREWAQNSIYVLFPNLYFWRCLGHAPFFFFFFLINRLLLFFFKYLFFIYLFIYGCVGSSFLREGFL